MRWRYFASALILAGLVLGCLLAEPKVNDPLCRGRRLSAWLIELDLENRTAEPARTVIQDLGTNAFPALTSMLQFKDSLWRRGLLSFNSFQSVIQLPVTPACSIRNRAVQGYLALGRRGKENVPTLIGLLESDSSPEVRSSVAAALGAIGPEARAAIPVLSRAAHDKSPLVRTESVSALANIQGWSPNRL